MGALSKPKKPFRSAYQCYIRWIERRFFDKWRKYKRPVVKDAKDQTDEEKKIGSFMTGFGRRHSVRRYSKAPKVNVSDLKQKLNATNLASPVSPEKVQLHAAVAVSAFSSATTAATRT